MIVFVDRYSEETYFLQKTLQSIHVECEFVIFQDSFFLPDGMLSMFEYLVRQGEEEPYQTKDLHYAFLDIPKYWQIQAEQHLGAVYDMGKKKAMIYFREPIEERIVARVEWFSEAGYVYKTDYYNRYGFVACRLLKNVSGMPLLKTYYTSQGEEILSYDLQSGNIVFFENGCVKHIYDSSIDLEKYLYARAMDLGEGIILTSQRQADILWEVDRENRAKVCVLLNDVREISQYKEGFPMFILSNADTTAYCGDTATKALRIYYNSSINKFPNPKGDILILTGTDQIEGIVALITKLPAMIFHIAANTAVSDKLLSLKNYANVRIYPQISRENLQCLLASSSYYLDINYGREIHNAVIQASMHNMLILGFENTLHNKDYVLEECVLPQGDSEGLLARIRMLAENECMMQTLVDRQKNLARKSLDSLISELNRKGDFNGNLCF